MPSGMPAIGYASGDVVTWLASKPRHGTSGSRLMTPSCRSVTGMPMASAAPDIAISAESLRIGHRRHERVLRLARVEARVLHDDRHVRLDDAGVVGGVWDGLGIAQIVEAQVQRAPRRHRHAIGPGRIAILEVEGDGDVCRLRVGV